MLNGMTTKVLRDGWLFFDHGRPYSGPVIFATRSHLDRFLAKAGNWDNREVRPVKAGEITAYHHHRLAYIGFTG